MKMRNVKKMLAAALSTSMVVGMSVPVLAADTGTTQTGTDISAPIYSFDVVDVVVPTTYAVAFNPEGLTVKTGGSNTSTDQILSKNFGIINKSNKDKVVTVSLTVVDENTYTDENASKITFVNSASEVSAAKDGEYKIHLTAIPADGTEVKIGTSSADKDTATSALGDVAMTKAPEGKEVTLRAGENKIGFKLDKAVYSPKSTGGVELGTNTSNNVQSNFEITGLAAAGAGITGFTFGGEMNANADWFKLQSAIKITAVYTNETAPSDATVISGTGAMVTLPAAPTFTTGTDVGTISYTEGSGKDALKEIKSITMLAASGNKLDGYNALSGGWTAATNTDGLITFASAYMSGYIRNFTDSTRKATVTYVTADDVTKTVEVDVKLR